MNLIKHINTYSRATIEKDSDNMYIFEDSTCRSSGSNRISDLSDYSKRFGKKNLKYPSNHTSQIIRGLKNAFPITTIKDNKSRKPSQHFWCDDDFETFKEIIDDDIEHIKKACAENKYKNIVFPRTGLINSPHSCIYMVRTPKIFKYIVEKELELLKFKTKKVTTKKA